MQYVIIDYAGDVKTALDWNDKLLELDPVHDRALTNVNIGNAIKVLKVGRYV